ncbi:hypothetical protein FGB62_1g433 [Gracilaria domingensis]|nr:hypothetical protein FGB62_1g433 [Gracilaria domingensis]
MINRHSSRTRREPTIALLLIMFQLFHSNFALNCTVKNGLKLCEIPVDIPPPPFDYGIPFDRNISRPRIRPIQQEKLTVRQSKGQFIADIVGERTASRAEAIDYCMELASETWPSAIPVTVKVNFSDLGGGLVLGSAQPSRSWIVNDYICPVALAEAAVLEDLNDGLNGNSGYDILMTINTGARWYEGRDAQAPRGHFDMVTVCLHEIHHGLYMTSGNIGISYSSVHQSYSAVFLREEVAGRFDAFMANQDGCQISSYRDSPQQLGTVLTGNNLWFGSESKIVARLHAPTPYVSGSSLYHLSESVYGHSGDDNDLMTPAIGSNYAQHNIGTVVTEMQELIMKVDGKPGAKVCATVNAPEVDNTPIAEQRPGVPNVDTGNESGCGGQGFTVSLAGKCVNGWLLVGSGIAGLAFVVISGIVASIVISGGRKQRAMQEHRRRQRRERVHIAAGGGNGGELV